MKNRATILTVGIILSMVILLLIPSAIVFSSNPDIHINTPENTTYFDRNVSLKFNVDEKPIMVGYKVDDEETKWFMVKDNEVAPVLEKELLYYSFEPWEGIIHIEDVPEKIAVGFYPNITQSPSGGLSTSFAIIKDGIVTNYIKRDSTTVPPLKIGEDQMLLSDYIIYPIGIDLINQIMELAVASRSKFTDLTNETVFEFDLANLSHGQHALTVFVIDKNGVESSVSTSFKVEEPDIVVLANSVGYPLAVEFFSYLEDRGIKPLRVTNDTFHDFKNHSSTLILGGPDAPEGVGEIVRDVLSQEEQESIRENGGRKMFVKENVWAEDQIVMVVAGSDRWQTQKAVGENGTNILNRLLTKDLEETWQTWVEIDPVQCGFNPWEIDWAKSHGNPVYPEYSDLTGYPRGDPIVIEEPEMEIIRNYYGREGADILEIKSIKYPPNIGTCDACSCPQGYTLYLLVQNPDVYKMLDLGYQISGEPPT